MIRIFRHYVPRWLLVLGTSEALILFGSVYLGVSFRLLEFNPTDKLLVGGIWPKGIGFAVVMLLLMAGVGLYQRGLRDDLKGLLFRVGVAFSLGLAAMATLVALVPRLSIGNTGFAVAFVCSAFGIGMFRLLVHKYSDIDAFRRRIVVLGTGSMAGQIGRRLRRRSDWQGKALLGFVPVPGEDSDDDVRRILTPKHTLPELLEELGADELVVAVDENAAYFPVNEVLDCKMSGVRVVDVATFFEEVTGRINIDALRPSSMVFADGFAHAVLKGVVHRAFDITVSSLMLLLGWPVMVGTAAAIWLESGGRGPVFYRQVRVGRNGRPFQILKFRSMTVDAESGGRPQWARSNDARVTAVGAVIRKLRIDELPQLFNVLKGEMSFVGPRPERPEFVEDLERKIPYYAVRHRVNPGITGWAQICYPYGASEDDARQKLQYDLYYIKNYSLFLDLMILIQTAQVVLWGKGAR
ncbi:MAG: TIGR03013 family PEP-CTERM/XrtA system glycosyltransferase [Ectothiorhodospiraceae bacterium]|nr:TIGR03013 family PEP-CTERM/XrtA system glycosyltransferase [Chromatiales bacterium]MCP5157208.1 TIGR03013 family PEP-CTERM/XrtA system glycosyltransferase [Ectothiorhodospiraceae bacterium]